MTHWTDLTHRVLPFSIQIEFASRACDRHRRRVAKAVLGRGLGELLEAHRAKSPRESNSAAIEERPGERLGMGVRTLLEPTESGSASESVGALRTAGTAWPVAAKPLSRRGILRSTPSADHPDSLHASGPATHAAIAPMFTVSLVLADLLLCFLAAILLGHPAIRASVPVSFLGTAAIATGAWLACLAALSGTERGRGPGGREGCD